MRLPVQANPVRSGGTTGRGRVQCAGYCLGEFLKAGGQVQIAAEPGLIEPLVVIVGGQLRQTGPAAPVAAEPADPDIARLLGWSELGHGTAASGTVRIGQLVLRDTAEGPHGPVQAFYRPEDVELRPTAPDERADGSLTASVERIIRTRPLARITLGCDPPIAALMLHRDINRLQLAAGNPVKVNVPPGGLRFFRTRTEP